MVGLFKYRTNYKSMKKNYLLILFCLTTLLSLAQTPITKANYELAERFSPSKVSKMVFSQSVDPHFFKKSNKFWYEYETPNGKYWYVVDGTTGEKTEMFDRVKMASEATLIVKDPFDAQHLPIKSVQLNETENAFILEFESSLKVKEYNYESEKEEEKPKTFFVECTIGEGLIKELKDYKKEKVMPKWASVSPDKNEVVFARSDFNLYSMDWENFEKALKNENDSTIVETQLTFDGSIDYSWGVSNYGKNNAEVKKELKKRKAANITWSPDSKNFVIERTDYALVEDFWVINALSSPRPTLETYKYHMAGEPNAPQEHLFVFNIEKREMKEVFIERFKNQTINVSYVSQLKSNRDDRIKSEQWLGDNHSFIVNITSRDLKRIDLCRVNLSDFSVKTLIEERLNKSLETRTVKIVNDEMIHWSERDGWGHLYLYSKDGILKNAITKGAFHVENVVGVDSKNRVVYFEAYGVDEKENPYYSHIYRINFDGSGMALLNKNKCNNTSIISDNNSYIVNTSSEVDSAPVSQVISNSGRVVATLEKTDLTQLFNAGYKFPEKFTVKADDGVTELYGVMYKPYDFDSTKVYPIIAYVYPGPQTEAVNAQFTILKADRVDRLAQLGFIVITVGNRGGHPNRSKWYHTYGYGNLRDYGLADKKAAIQQLAYRHKFIDINKVGIHGHSGGGFMSTAAMLVYPDFFKVAVSCAGNHENNIYNRWWSEKHHGVDEVVSEKGDTTFKYEIDKNSEIAKNLKGKLLLITGDQDNNVHPANTLRVVDALIRANKRFDMLVLPGQRHAFGDMTEYFFWRLADYFSENLIGDSEKSVNIPQMNR